MSKEQLYTTQLQAGVGLLEETQTLLEKWSPGMSATDLYQAALDSGDFPNVTARRLRNIVAECFAPRYLNPSKVIAPALKKLLGQISHRAINQLFYLYTARANLIFRDFVTQVYWERYASGYNQLESQDCYEFVERATRDGKTRKIWSDSTIRRISSYLMSACVDYCLVRTVTRVERQMTPIRIEPSVVIYLAYDLHLQGLSDNNIIHHPDWQLFGLEPTDVRDELKRLSVQKFWIIQTAADVVSISWTYKDMEEVIDVIADSGL